MQRPVFYAIGIIITAYLPIFTLQAWKAGCSSPWRWTVAFALLGALIFSIVRRARAVAAFSSATAPHEWHNPVMDGFTGQLSPRRCVARSIIGWITSWPPVAAFCHRRLS